VNNTLHKRTDILSDIWYMQKLDSYLAIKLESKNKKREQRPYILQNAVNHLETLKKKKKR